jgi:hypothetical protein
MAELGVARFWLHRSPSKPSHPNGRRVPLTANNQLRFDSKPGSLTQARPQTARPSMLAVESGLASFQKVDVTALPARDRPQNASENRREMLSRNGYRPECTDTADCRRIMTRHIVLITTLASSSL